MDVRCLFKSFVIVVAVTFPLVLRAGDRTTISLNGTWQIEDSKDAAAVPVAWKHKVPVPGLAHSAEPAFPQVDQFDSRLMIQNLVAQGKLRRAPSPTTQACRGRSGTGSGTVADLRSPIRRVWQSCASTKRSSGQQSG